jgi:hypothetical protein
VSAGELSILIPLTIRVKESDLTFPLESMPFTVMRSVLTESHGILMTVVSSIESDVVTAWRNVPFRSMKIESNSFGRYVLNLMVLLSQLRRETSRESDTVESGRIKETVAFSGFSEGGEGSSQK